jgi:SpoVK/Ycf46/Vps4 family AAA+-type ATPase
MHLLRILHQLQLLGAVTEDVLKQVFSEAENQKTILFFKDIDVLLSAVNFSFFLFLLENVNTKNGLFIIATCPAISSQMLKYLVQPFRFDKHIVIKHPSLEIIKNFVNSKFKEIDQENKNKISTKLFEKKFTYRNLIELYIKSNQKAMSCGLKLKVGDIEEELVGFNKDVTNKLSIDKYIKE